LGVPAQGVAGDSWIWKVPDFTDYPQSEGWALSYRLHSRTLSAPPLTIAAVWQATGDDANHWLATISATASAVLLAGSYELRTLLVGSGAYAGRQHTVAVDLLDVLVDTRSTAADTYLTHAERMLALLDAAVEGRIPAGMESYQISGRAVSLMQLSELVALRSKYAAMVKRQRTGQFGTPIAAQFTHA
jgi:hypothetical protein